MDAEIARTIDGGQQALKCFPTCRILDLGHVLWLPDGWEVRRGAPVVMHEPLMRKFGVGAKRMPTLELRDKAGHAAKLEPHALWIIGENGRVDLKCDERYHYIIYTAENFARSNWEVFRAERRCDSEAVTREWLRRVLQ